MMPKKRRDTRVVDTELDMAVHDAINRGIPLSTVCRRAEIDQSTLWKWRTGRTSPTMNTRQAVLDAIRALIAEQAP
jgi:transposase-like protein